MPSAALREPRNLGPYKLLEVLGEGGMGVVYRAQDPSGELFAVKTARSRRAREVNAVRGEIARLRRVHHCGIVRIYEDGVAEGVPWYSMELLEGGALSTALESRRLPASQTLVTAEPSHTTEVGHGQAREGASHTPNGAWLGGSIAALDLSVALRIGLQLLETLAFLHGQGIVHRDIKPENVLLRGDGTPVLLDLGIALETRWAGGGHAHRESLEPAGRRQGTTGYSAPEQARGEFVDARADLYSFGCLLFEMVTGVPVFEARSREELWEKHFHEHPRRASQLAAHIPAVLDDLIASLLEKDRRNRVPHAEAAIGVLVDLVRPGEPHASRAPALFRPQLVGRDAVLGRLEPLLRGLGEGRGAFVMIEGESGVGKTFLVNEVARRAALRGFEVVTAEAIAVEVSSRSGVRARGGALHPFRRLLRAAVDQCLEGDVAMRTALASEAGRVLAGYEPALMEIPEVLAQPHPAEMTPPAERKRILLALRDCLLSFAARGPVVLVVDDLQWADELSLAFLCTLSPELFTENAILVLSTCRAEERGDAVAEVAAKTHAEIISLARLGETSIVSMVKDMLGTTVLPTGLADALARNSEGNPFFVAEYARAAIELGLLVESDGQWTTTQTLASGASLQLSLPGSLKELVTTRLARLAPIARRLVDIAAVLGREVDQSLVVSAGELTEGIQTAFDTLCAHQVLEQRAGTDAGGYRFVHDKLREVAYALLSDTERLALHHAAAEAIEALGKPDERAAELAYHFHQAGDENKEAIYSERAGMIGYGRAAYREAIPLLRRAFTLHAKQGATPTHLARLHFAIGFSLEYIKENHEALVQYVAALQQLGHPLQVHNGAVNLTLIRQLVEQVLRRFLPQAAPLTGAQRTDLLLASKVAIRMSTSMLFDPSKGAVVFAASLASANYAERAGAISAHAVGVIGWAAGSIGLVGTARRYFARLSSRADPLDRAGLAQARLFEATFCTAQDDRASARHLAEHCLDEYTAMHDPWSASAAALILGVLDYVEGRLTESYTWFKHATDLAGPIDSRNACYYDAFAAMAALAMGAVDIAASLRDAHRIGLEQQSELLRGNWHAVAAKLAAVRGEVSAALDEASKALVCHKNPIAASLNGLPALGVTGEASLLAWRVAGPSTSGSARALALRVHALTRFWVVSYPQGRLEALLQEGEIADRLGFSGRASFALRACATLAKERSLPIHEGRAYAALAATHGTSRQEAERLRARARAIFERIGAGGYAAMMDPSATS